MERASDDESEYPLGSRLLVFTIALVLALGLWSLVNLSREYNLNINMPLTVGNMPAEKALTRSLPSTVTVSITGEGWQLINLYNNPPQIYVDVTNEEVDLFEQVQQQMNAAPNLTVQKVQPLSLRINLEDKVQKKIPVISRVSLSFEDQYGLVGEPRLQPDSVTVSGASSLLKDLKEWQTDSVHIDGVEQDLQQEVELRQSGLLLDISPTTVTLLAEVAQYTEGETRVFVEARNMPQGRTVTFSPSFINVKYNVPITEYTEVRDMASPFMAYVDYEQIQQDSSGFVVPRIEKSVDEKYHVQVRSFQPAEVSYFMVIDND